MLKILSVAFVGHPVLGNLELDDSMETSITSGNKQITNEAAVKNIKLDCGMGNVQVEFEED